MMIGGLGDTSVHIISRVGGSGTEWRLRELLWSSGLMARTGFLADNAHFCRNCRGMNGKGIVFRHLNLTHFVDDHEECLVDISTQMQGSAVLVSDPYRVCLWPGCPTLLDTTARNHHYLRLGGGKLLGFRLTCSS